MPETMEEIQTNYKKLRKKLRKALPIIEDAENKLNRIKSTLTLLDKLNGNVIGTLDESDLPDELKEARKQLTLITGEVVEELIYSEINPDDPDAIPEVVGTRTVVRRGYFDMVNGYNLTDENGDPVIDPDTGQPTRVPGIVEKLTALDDQETRELLAKAIIAGQ